jgi:pyrroline-5-carboxylate reductase
MPNTALLCGAGATAVSGGKYAKKRHIALAKNIFSVSGSVVEISESKINAVTALSGSGPAYVFYLAELLKTAGIKMGLEGGIAEKLSRQTVYGAGKMLKERDIAASELRKNVTSPGGTTEAALNYLLKKDFAGIFIEAVKQAEKRANALAR